LPSAISAAKWKREIILAAEEIIIIKKNIETNETLPTLPDEDLDERN